MAEEGQRDSRMPTRLQDCATVTHPGADLVGFLDDGGTSGGLNTRYEKKDERVPTQRVGEREKTEGYRSEYRHDDINDGYGEYYEPYRRQSRAPSPVAGGSIETHTVNTRRVRQKMDFLKPEGGRDEAFHDLREPSQLARHDPVRRVKVKPNNNKLDISDSGDLDDLINFFQEKGEEKSYHNKLTGNPFSAFFPTMEVAQSYIDSHKCEVVKESEENKKKLQIYIN